MNPRAVFAACAALTLTVTAAVAARQYFYDPFRDLPAGNGKNWRAEVAFRGEARFYGADGTAYGSVSSGDNENAPIEATVTVSGTPFKVAGAGRHELRDSAGALLGYVELVPQSAGEQAEWRRQHNAQYGIEEPLKGSYGAKDGFGMATGYFGDGDKRLEWRFNGTGKIIFRRLDDGKIAYTARAAGLTPELRTEQQRNLSPEDFALTVAETVADPPTFAYRIGDQQKTESALAPFPLTLPDGTRLQVEIIPLQ